MRQLPIVKDVGPSLARFLDREGNERQNSRIQHENTIEQATLQALAPARVLARVPYLEHLLGLVQHSLLPVPRLWCVPIPTWPPT